MVTIQLREYQLHQHNGHTQRSQATDYQLVDLAYSAKTATSLKSVSKVCAAFSKHNIWYVYRLSLSKGCW